MITLVRLYKVFQKSSHPPPKKKLLEIFLLPHIPTYFCTFILYFIKWR